MHDIKINISLIKRSSLQVLLRTFMIMPFVLLSISSPAQTENELSTQFERFSQSCIREKIFVHSDKDVYLPGEICWFKLYCVDAYFHKPLDISKVGYLELLDGANKPITQIKVSLNHGSGNGSFQFPVNLFSGKYKIRSYTNWMKNFDPVYFFEKEITVINPKDFHKKDSAGNKPGFSIRFYPEGGNLVNGIQSTLAFKITDQYNRGVSCGGLIVDDLHDTIQHFTTYKFGMGKILFTPESKRSYQAVIALQGGGKIVQPLPVAFDNGIVMQLADSSADELTITLRAKGTDFSGDEVYLIAHTRGVLKSVQRGKLNSSAARFSIKKEGIGDGISVFTIFNSKKIPVCERLYFKNPQQKLQITASTDREKYSTREKITLGIHTDSTRGFEPADLSMAVYKIDSLQKVDPINIENYLLLSSDLQEPVESPGYYFDDSNNDREILADNLMLTQGWRRFRWEDVLQNKKPVIRFLPEYAGHLVEGNILDTATRTIARNYGAYISAPGTRAQLGVATSDTNGVLRFDMKDFYTNAELVIQPQHLQDSFLRIEIQSPFARAFSNKPLSPFSTTTIDSTALADYNAALLIQGRYVKNKMDKFYLPPIDTLPFYGKPDISYLLDNYVRFTTIEEVLREYVQPISVRNRGGKFEVWVWDKNREHVPLEPGPLVLLDAVPVDINRVFEYDPLKVKRLDVVTSTYYYGNNSYGGILSFVTYDGNMQNFELDPHIAVIDYQGLQAQREFYAPSYDTKELLESRLPDFRRLLYWAPDLMTDQSGERNISFFSSDLPGRYVIMIQGINVQGRMGYTTAYFTVSGTH